MHETPQPLIWRGEELRVHPTSEFTHPVMGSGKSKEISGTIFHCHRTLFDNPELNEMNLTVTAEYYFTSGIQISTMMFKYPEHEDEILVEMKGKTPSSPMIVIAGYDRNVGHLKSIYIPTDQTLSPFSRSDIKGFLINSQGAYASNEPRVRVTMNAYSGPKTKSLYHFKREISIGNTRYLYAENWIENIVCLGVIDNAAGGIKTPLSIGLKPGKRLLAPNPDSISWAEPTYLTTLNQFQMINTP